MPKPNENRQWRLRKLISDSELIGAEHFQFTSTPKPTINHGEVLLRTIYLGTSPAQRSYLSTGGSMHNKIAAGDVMRGRGVAMVIESESDNFNIGDVVSASTGWQDYSVHNQDAEGLLAVSKIQNPIQPYSLSLGILGASAYTAYFGLTDVAKASAGDTVVITAAAGGVGSCAVQIAKALGCRVIGIAGGPIKCAWLRESLSVDVAIDYQHQDIDRALQEYCPNGFDVLFDNVGGQQLNTLLKHLSIGARIAICGYISTDYKDVAYGPENYIYLLRQRASMAGFFIFDYQSRFDEADHVLRQWYSQGLLVDTSDISYGLETMPNALKSLFTGANQGVRICQVSPDGIASCLTNSE